MIVAMKNRVRTALVIVACLVGLTGCVKLDADLKVNSDETVSGTMKIGVDKQLVESSGQSLDKVRQQVESGIKETTTDGVTCKSFEDDKYVGSDCQFDAVPFSKMGSSTGDGVGFRKDGDKFVVTVKGMNLGNVPAASHPVVNFKITMPGKILEHDAGAKVSGRTATYDSLDKLGNVSLTSEASGGFPLWALILIIVVLLIAAAAAVFFVLRGRKKRAQQQQYGQYGQYPGQPQPGQWGPQYGGQPGGPGQYGPQGQPGSYGPQGQPGQYGQRPQQYGQPGPGQYPGQPQPPQQGQPGQWGPQQPAQGPPQGPPQQGQGGWGQPPQGPPSQGQQGRPPQGQPPQGPPPQGPPPQGPPQQGQHGQGGWGQPPQQGGQQGGWIRPPDDDGQ
jgi:hypothetical protein